MNRLLQVSLRKATELDIDVLEKKYEEREETQRKKEMEALEAAIPVVVPGEAFAPDAPDPDAPDAPDTPSAPSETQMLLGALKPKEEKVQIRFLSLDEIEALYARMPQFTDPGSLKARDYFSREASLKAPETAAGKVVSVTFPPTEMRERAAAIDKQREAPPLDVISHTPTDECVVKIENFSLQVMFSQPMYEDDLMTLSTPSADTRAPPVKKIPVTVEPALPAGEWKWDAPTKLTYRCTFDLMGSTKYRCAIPKGTKSVNGYVLKKTVGWTFSTPRMRVKAEFPSSSIPTTQPLFGVRFSQDVDPDVIIPKLKMKASGILGGGVEVTQVTLEAAKARFATDAFLKKFGNSYYPNVSTDIEVTPGEFVFFTPTETLPVSKSYNVTIPKNLESLHGNLPSTTEASFSASTYPNLELINLDDLKATVTGKHYDKTFRFSRDLDKEYIEGNFERLVSVAPNMPNMTCEVTGSSMRVKADCREDSSYKFSLSERIRDLYGVQCGGAVNFSMKTVLKILRCNGVDNSSYINVNTRVAWNVRFSDRLNKAYVDEHLADIFSVTPPLEHQVITVVDKMIKVEGLVHKTKHTVRVSRQLMDWDDYRLVEEFEKEIDVRTPHFGISGSGIPSDILDRTPVKWRLNLRNKIDTKEYELRQGEMIKVDGLSDCTVWIENESFWIQGTVKPGKKFVTVKLTDVVKDVFDNHLSELILKSRVSERILTLSSSPHGQEVYPHDETTWSLRFTDNLDEVYFKEHLDADHLVVVEPPLQNQVIELNGARVHIKGKATECTKYSVVVSRGIQDRFGTKLKKRYSLSWTTKRIPRDPKRLECQHHSKIIIHDPTDAHHEPPCLRFRVRNIVEQRVVAFHVDPRRQDFERCPLGEFKVSVWDREKVTDIYDVIGLPKGQKVFDAKVPTHCEINKMAEVRLDIVPFLQYPDEQLGQVFICLVHPDDIHKSRFVWIQATRMAVDAVFLNDHSLTLCATSLLTGRAVQRPRFRLMRPTMISDRMIQKKSLLKKTDLRKVYEWSDDKVESIEIPGDDHGVGTTQEVKQDKCRFVVIAESGNDVCCIPGVRKSVDSGDENKTRLLSFVFDDRKIFKPKEKARVRAMLRKLVVRRGERRRMEMYDQGTKVKYEIFDARSVKFDEGELEMDNCSGVFLEFLVKDSVNLGDCKCNFEIVDADDSYERKFTHVFQVEEFKQPDFKASCTIRNRTYVANDRTIATGQASYFSGPGLSDCDVNWEVNQKPTEYSPPGPFQEFSFKLSDDHNQRNIPPFVKKSRYSLDEPKPTYKFSGKTNKDGEHKLLIEFKKPGIVAQIPAHPRLPIRVLAPKAKPTVIRGVALRPTVDVQFVTLIGGTAGEIIAPVSITAKANIQDLNRETLSSQSSFIVHPCSYYVGIRKKKEFVAEKENFPIDLVVLDPNGHAVAGPELTLEIFRSTRKVHEVKFTSAEGIMEVEMNMKFGSGRFHVVATVSDDLGLKHAASLSFHVSGAVGIQKKKPKPEEEEELKTELEGPQQEKNVTTDEVEIILDKKEYFVGDKARVLVRSPINGEGLLMILAHGVLHREKFSLADSKEFVLELPLGDAHVPNALINAYVFGHKNRVDINALAVDWDPEAKNMPAQAKGSVPLVVSPESYSLDVEVEPEEEILPPSAETTVRVKVSKGDSVVTLLIVDESVLALSDHNLENPVAEFYPNSIVKTYEHFFREHLFYRLWKANLAKIEEERRRREEERRQRELEEARRLEAERQRKEAERRAKEEARKKRLAEQALQKLNLEREMESKRQELAKMADEIVAMPCCAAPQCEPEEDMYDGACDDECEEMSFRDMRKERKKQSRPPPPAKKPSASPKASFSLSMAAPRSKGKSRGSPKKKKKKESSRRGAARGRGKKMMRGMMAECSMAPPMRMISKDSIGGGGGAAMYSDDDLDEYESDEDFEDASPMMMRKDFEATVIFSTCVRTDADGAVTIPIKLPDQLTKYRIWVLAENGSKFFGFGESHVIAQMPFSIRPALPGFLNFGDSTEFSYVLSNQTDHSIEVRVAVRVSDNVRIADKDEKGHTVEIPQGKRAEIRVPIVADHEGLARVQIGAQVARTKFSDAVEKELNVFSPSTNSAYVTYGELDGDTTHVQKIVRPFAEECHSGFGGISLTTSSTAMQNLCDSVLYLVGYQYDCCEQASSRMLSICSMQDILEEFNMPQMPTRERMEIVMNRELKKLEDAQKKNGGFGMWDQSSSLNLYLSCHVAHALIRTREQNKYHVDQKVLDKCKSFCLRINSFFGQLLMGKFATRVVHEGPQ